MSDPPPESSAARLEVLAAAARHLAEVTTDCRAGLEPILASLATMLGGCASVHVLSDDGQRLELSASSDRDGALASEIGRLLAAAPDHDQPAAMLASEREMCVDEESLRDRRAALADVEARRLDAAGITTLLAVPLRGAGRTLGTLSIARGRATGSASAGCAWADGDRLLVRALADQIALAMASTQLHVRASSSENGWRRALDDLRRAEEELRQAQKMEAVGRLAGSIAHDFNNLLTVILTNCDIVLDAALDAELREDILGIRAAGQRGVELTRQLLAFGRRQVLRPGVLDLNAVVEGMRVMLGRLLGESIDLDIALAHDTWRVCMDAGQVEQVILNLAINARDAMPDGGTLAISTAPVVLDQAAAAAASLVEGPYVALSIVDSGIGMDPETQRRAFEPFFTTKEKGRGTGLGLATVFGIVSQAGGGIGLRSAPGAGTAFTIHLPRAESNLIAADPASPLSGALRGTETVLLVEDDEHVRRAARNGLERYGYQVIEVRDGREALRACEERAGPIDVLLTDMVLPRMSGRQLAERVTGLRPGVRVLFMSGYAEGVVAEFGMLPTDSTYLRKPLTPESLARGVRLALEAPPRPPSLDGAAVTGA